VFYLLHRGGLSLAAIGRIFRRDHTTVRSGILRYVKLTNARAPRKSFEATHEMVADRLGPDGDN
jgi:chromosomal replication initiation ATPase DnaA